MIERYVFVKLDDPYANPDTRAELAAEARRVLAAVPGVVGVRVGVPADDPSERSWDLSFAVRFARLDDVEAYRNHPEHRRFVDEILAPRMQVIKAWNFGVSDDEKK